MKNKSAFIVGINILLFGIIGLLVLFSAKGGEIKEIDCISRLRVESLDACGVKWCYYTMADGKRYRLPLEHVCSNGEYICEEILKSNN